MLGILLDDEEKEEPTEEETEPTEPAENPLVVELRARVEKAEKRLQKELAAKEQDKSLITALQEQVEKYKYMAQIAKLQSEQASTPKEPLSSELAAVEKASSPAASSTAPPE